VSIRRILNITPVLLGSFLTLFLCVGMRLNARLRGSFIKPFGGTLHWDIIGSPMLFCILYCGAICFALLNNFFYHINTESICQSYDKQIAPNPNQKNPLPFSIEQSEALFNVKSSNSIKEREWKDIAKLRRKNDSKHTSIERAIESRMKKNPNLRLNGDVSELISSDSEGDDEFLTPTYNSDSSSKKSHLNYRYRSPSNASTYVSTDMDFDDSIYSDYEVDRRKYHKKSIDNFS